MNVLKLIIGLLSSITPMDVDPDFIRIGGDLYSMRLANKVAIITGSAGGMGKAAAELFAREGASVVVTDIAAAEGEETVRGIRKEDGSVTAIAGATWDRIMDVNLKSAFLCSKYVIPHMVKQGKGSIINVASFVAFMGCTVPQDAYTASKGGMLALTKSFAVQYGRHGIRCNAICPGPIETPLLRVLWTSEEARDLRLNRIPLGRFGEAKDIVYMALYLASDESSWTTGAWLMVDGGISSNYF